MTQITVKYVNPRQDKRPPSIKGEDGAYYTITDEKFNLFKVGQTFDAPVTKNAKGYLSLAEWFDPTGSNGTNVAPQQTAAAAAQPSNGFARPAAPAIGHNGGNGNRDVAICTQALIKAVAPYALYDAQGRLDLNLLQGVADHCLRVARYIVAESGK